jgi:hypothetical protein
LYTLALVSCVKRKSNHICAAEDLYQSVWFNKAKRYVTIYSDDWYILSAKYHLIHHLELVEPYDLTLYHMNKEELQEWRTIILRQLSALSFDNLLVLAGKRYAAYIKTNFTNVLTPLAGLGIGQQLSWLDKNV